MGRFITQDPIGLDGGMNLYRYVPNPTGWIDLGGGARQRVWESASLATTSPLLGNPLVGHDCQGYFPKLAQFNKVEQTVADPKAIRTFKPDVPSKPF